MENPQISFESFDDTISENIQYQLDLYRDCERKMIEACRIPKRFFEGNQGSIIDNKRFRISKIKFQPQFFYD